MSESNLFSGFTKDPILAVDLDPAPQPTQTMNLNYSEKKVVPAVEKPTIDIAPASDEPKDLTKNRLNAMNLAKSELKKIKKFNATQYGSLRTKYIQSLSTVDQKMLRDIETKMRKDIFEEQIEKRIIRFMVANPGAWNSATRPQ